MLDIGGCTGSWLLPFKAAVHANRKVVRVLQRGALASSGLRLKRVGELENDRVRGFCWVLLHQSTAIDGREERVSEGKKGEESYEPLMPTWVGACDPYLAS